MSWKIGIYVYQDAEVLDFAGPYEVFTTAARLSARAETNQNLLFQVALIASSMQIVAARGDFKIQPHYTIQDHPPLDVLIIPGGVHTPELAKPELITWIQTQSRKTAVTASVCTGAFLLAQAGLLEGKPATTHWEDIPDLQEAFPQVEVQENVRWIENGQVITSAGISAGIDMSLHLVERLVGRDLALQTARQMEFRWAG